LNRQKRLVGIVSLGDIALFDGAGSAGSALCVISEPGGDHSQTSDGLANTMASREMGGPTHVSLVRNRATHSVRPRFRGGERERSSPTRDEAAAFPLALLPH